MDDMVCFDALYRSLEGKRNVTLMWHDGPPSFQKTALALEIRCPKFYEDTGRDVC